MNKLLKKRRHIKRLCAMGMAAVMALITLTYATPAALAVTKQQELEAAKKEAQTSLDEANAQVEAAKKKKDEAAELKTALQSQSTLIAENISILVEQISDTEAQVVEKQDAVNAKQAEIDERYADFKQRMGAMQELHDGGSVAMLSSATNLYELLTFNEILQEISEKDNQILDEMETARTELAQQQAALEEQQAALETQRSQLEGKKTELAANIQAADSTISAADAEKQAGEAAAESARKAMDAASEALDAFLRQQNNAYSGELIYCSGLAFRCPLNSYKYVSCYYGGASGHKGVDLAAASGTPIYAAEGGVVTVATYHYSYGNYVQIYHGTDDNGTSYASLYAHMVQAPSVSVGQHVSQGDLIGYVGSTGNSTGPHLHLELRVGGSRVNPQSYIPT